MPNVNVTIRMDKDLKKKTDELLNELGMSFTTAVTIFAKQILREQRIPFEISKQAVASNNEVKKISKKLIENNKESYSELAK